MNIIQNYKVSVLIGKKELSSVFYETSSNQYDLRYGFAKYTRCMHDSLASAKQDFLTQLKKEYPDTEILLGNTKEISEVKAKKLSPNSNSKETIY